MPLRIKSRGVPPTRVRSELASQDEPQVYTRDRRERFPSPGASDPVAPGRWPWPCRPCVRDRPLPRGRRSGVFEGWPSVPPGSGYLPTIESRPGRHCARFGPLQPSQSWRVNSVADPEGRAVPAASRSSVALPRRVRPDIGCRGRARCPSGCSARSPRRDPKRISPAFGCGPRWSGGRIPAPGIVGSRPPGRRGAPVCSGGGKHAARVRV